jgi:hypothetical protein
MGALQVLHDDVTAIASVVSDQLASEIGRNKSVRVVEASRRRGQDHAVRYKFRSPDDRRSGRCLFGIAGEKKAPIADQQLPPLGLFLWHPCGSGCTLSGNGDCAVETPTRTPRGRGGPKFQRRSMISSPVSLACVISTFQEPAGQRSSTYSYCGGRGSPRGSNTRCAKDVEMRFSRTTNS